MMSDLQGKIVKNREKVEKSLKIEEKMLISRDLIRIFGARFLTD